MATLPLSDNAERLGRLRWLLLEVFEWAGALSRDERHDHPGDARIAAEWSNVLAEHAERILDRIPSVPGLDPDRLTRPGPTDVPAVTALRGGTPASGTLAALAAALAAIGAEVAAHRRLVDPVTDGPTARLLDRLAHDLAQRP